MSYMTYVHHIDMYSYTRVESVTLLECITCSRGVLSGVAALPCCHTVSKQPATSQIPWLSPWRTGFPLVQPKHFLAIFVCHADLGFGFVLSSSIQLLNHQNDQTCVCFLYFNSLF